MSQRRTFLTMAGAGLAWATLAAEHALRTEVGAACLTAPILSAPRTLSTLPPFDGATLWLNSPPLSPAELRGKVVLVDFWTYSCINWRREFPYVRAWAEKYEDRGLVVIGVHSPEFEFERKIANVKKAVRNIGVNYAVAVDSDHHVWRAYGNGYWPALYFFDAQGRPRHHHFGEGDYDRSERVIQQLLSEAGTTNVNSDLVLPEAEGPEAAPDWDNLRSPETYVGYARLANLTSTKVPVEGSRSVYEAPARLRLNQWALRGEWSLQPEAAILSAAGGRMAYQFHARDLHLVMGPATPGKPVKFRVSIDGDPPVTARGVDVDQQGRGVADDHRMYQLVRQTRPIGAHRFEIEFFEPGIEVFSFTFG